MKSPRWSCICWRCDLGHHLLVRMIPGHMSVSQDFAEACWQAVDGVAGGWKPDRFTNSNNCERRLPVGSLGASVIGSRAMSDWLYNLPIWWMALVIFTAIYCVSAAVYWIVTELAVDERARAFKALSPGIYRHSASYSASW